ncbi:hypothetical protein SAMN05421823_11957 [Catalinimonas alkaloidigena]|uniref:Uncharacterized protein n=1 Tax=Catalinimonas alkaloidigena TaxID=1075417 RepID=A0A1G9V9F8_9BACT|nr:hypothetical protein [Catalinimonas alkaloidigena]SDM68717.1 hypothetical protein SAMN05421823_11957 [Catalinimonas alkaloidigena]
MFQTLIISADELDSHLNYEGASRAISRSVAGTTTTPPPTTTQPTISRSSVLPTRTVTRTTATATRSIAAPEAAPASAPAAPAAPAAAGRLIDPTLLGGGGGWGVSDTSEETPAAPAAPAPDATSGPDYLKWGLIGGGVLVVMVFLLIALKIFKSK